MEGAIGTFQADRWEDRRQRFLGYTLHFFDSRLRSVSVPWDAGQSFKDQVRAAVKERVARLSGPLGREEVIV